MHFFPWLMRLSLRKCLWLVEPRTPVCLNKQDVWGYKCLSFLVCIKKVFYQDSACGGKTLLSLKIRRHACSEHLSVLPMWPLTAGQPCPGLLTASAIHIGFQNLFQVSLESSFHPSSDLINEKFLYQGPRQFSGAVCCK